MMSAICLALLQRGTNSAHLPSLAPPRLLLRSFALFRRSWRREADPMATARAFSSSATSTNSSNTTTNSTRPAPTPTVIVEEEPEIILYERKTNPSFTLMRSGLALSTFHTGYWIWYNTDFIPLVNQAAMQELHIDPILGYAGFSLATVVNPGM